MTEADKLELEIMEKASCELPRDHNKLFAAGSINDFDRYSCLFDPVPEFRRKVALNFFTR